MARSSTNQSAECLSQAVSSGVHVVSAALLPSPAGHSSLVTSCVPGNSRALVMCYSLRLLPSVMLARTRHIKLQSAFLKYCLWFSKSQRQSNIVGCFFCFVFYLSACLFSCQYEEQSSKYEMEKYMLLNDLFTNALLCRVCCTLNEFCFTAGRIAFTISISVLPEIFFFC